MVIEIRDIEDIALSRRRVTVPADSHSRETFKYRGATVFLFAARVNEG